MSKSKKKTLLDSSDFYRLTKAIDVDDEKDFEILSWCSVLLSIKLIDFDSQYPESFLVIKPDPVLRGLRMLLSRPETIPWRSRHPDDVKLIRSIEKSRSLLAMVQYLSDNINMLKELISIL